ncbi:phage portal protein family protein [Pararhodobacter sp.]|uniref:phage portal protein family protein n=1 Tax=Pararhodobacter sp. TaxID=2127056 RepID=UPI002FDE2871
MALLDAYGRPVKTQALVETGTARPGMTGVRQVWAGSAASGLTPVKLASILSACDQGEHTDYVILAEEMEERDPHYASVLGTRKRAVSGVEPVVKAGGDDTQAQKIADAVREAITEHEGFADLVEDMLDGLGKGWSVVEIDWGRSAREWWPERFEHVEPRFIRFDRETLRIPRLLTDTALVEGEPFAPFKFLFHTPRLKSGIPLRGGLARLVAFTWMCKAFALKDWVSFAETYGLPLRLGRYGPEATREDVEKLFLAVANIGTDAAAVLPKSMEIEFQNAAGGASGDQLFENLARYLDEQTSKAVLGQTMASGIGTAIAGGAAAVWNAGAALIQSLWDGAVAKFNEFLSWVSGIPGRIVEAIGNIDLTSAIRWPSMPSFLGGAANTDLPPAQAEIVQRSEAAGWRRPDGSRALGGPVRPGFLYEINEQGQEFFMPDSPGRVIPAGMMETVQRISMGGIPATQREQAVVLNRVLDDVAKTLRNTRTVCRKCYVHPLVITGWQEGTLAPRITALDKRLRRPRAGLRRDEALVLRWLEQQDSA